MLIIFCILFFITITYWWRAYGSNGKYLDILTGQMFGIVINCH